MFPVGHPPPAVGTVSTYWLTAELPGGARLRVQDFAAAAVGRASAAKVRINSGMRFIR
jgi:hypothetical protein